MSYLHSCGIIHRDLASRNIFIVFQGKNADYFAKVGDFGMSRNVVNYYQINETHTLPVRWCAPEVFTHQQYTKESDIWSFGVTMWEILEYGRLPYTELDHTTLIKKVLEEGYRLPRPANCTDDLWNILTACFQEDPLQRPPFKELVEKFQ